MVAAESGLVVGQIGQGCPIFSDPISDRWPRVQHQACGDLQATDLKTSQGDVVEGQAAREVAQTDGKEGWREIAGEARAQIESRRGGTPDMHFLAWTIQRFKKPKPLYVIHVEMSEQEVNALRLRSDGRPQPSNSGPGIEHQDRYGERYVPASIGK